MMASMEMGMTPAGTDFVALAPFLRLNIAGDELPPVAGALLEQAKAAPDDANLWMNLATTLLCLGQRDVGLAVQKQALAQKRVFHLPALQQPAAARVLLLCVPGELSANTPLDCLLETGDVDLDFLYLLPDEPWEDALNASLPEHDVLLVAMSEADDNLALLKQLEMRLASWPKPVLNAPAHIPAVGREAAYALLHDAPGIVMPPTRRARRAALQRAADGTASLRAIADDLAYPVIARPVGSHAGRDLARIEDAAQLGAYLAGVADDEFFVSPFIDYRGSDGYFRKMRVALVDGEPFACHMAVSSHWMIHYVNAGMYEEAWKREEEAAFMDGFAAFAQRHRAALQAMHARTGLDYVCIDCAETRDGRLLIFEIDHAMVVHAMDPEDMFPYKQTHMHKVSEAFRAMLLRRMGQAS